MKPPVISPVMTADRDELGALAEHLHLCTASLGPGFRMRCLAEAVHAFMAPRFVTTVFISCLVIISAAMAS